MPILKKLPKIALEGKKKLFWLISLALIFLLIIGGVAFWFYNLKKQSLEHAVVNINHALEKDDLVLLSMYVDFDLLSKSFVQNIKQYWPDVTIEGARKKELENIIQQKIITTLENNDVNIPNKRNIDKNIPVQLQAVEQDRFFDFLPSDFTPQLKKQKITVYRKDEDIAILGVPVKHKEADYVTEIKLLAQKAEDRWYITKIVNGYDLIKIHMDALNKKNSEAESAWRLYNEKISSQMDKYYHVTDCKAFFEPNDNKADFVLTIIVDGVNTSKDSIRSAGMHCLLYDSDKNIITTLPLNSARRLSPEEKFRQKWFFDVTEGTPELLLFTNEDDLTCKVELSSIVLSNGSFFYIATPPNSEQVRP